ncbi:MAG TPA: HAD-IA family hydrolase [Acidimicrobiales bacterium]|jgi:phosphoglycolate phosphatase|nr:HAD-IA family hydrolase [Acidimicrobiales bacterium]
MRFTVVLFDLDGTLTDPEVGITRSLAYALDAVGRPVTDLASLRSLIGPPLIEAFTEMGLTPAEVDRALASYRERYTEVGMFENELIDGMASLLADLVSDGIRLGIATSKPERFAMTIVEHFGIAEHFEVVAGASFDESRRHKDEVIAYAMEGLGDPEPRDAVMVGDREHDVLGARANAIDAIGVLWGYGSRAELEAARPLALVATLSELRALLAG